MVAKDQRRRDGLVAPFSARREGKMMMMCHLESKGLMMKEFVYAFERHFLLT